MRMKVNEMKLFANQNNLSKARFWEFLSAGYLSIKGYRVLSLNTRYSGVEVDILAQKDNLLVLVEVKYRKQAARFDGVIHPTQQARLIRAARSLEHKYSAKTSVRIDCILCTSRWPFLNHVVGVFP